MDPSTLCEVMKITDRLGGVYHVEDIVQNPEEFPGETRVVLEPVEGWGEDPVGDVEISFNAGPTADGGYVGPAAGAPKLDRGEEIVALFLVHEYEDGRVDHRINHQKVFRATEEGYTNGYLFKQDPVSLSELESMILELREDLESGSECSFDVEPSHETAADYERPEPDVGQVVEGEVEFGKDGG